MYISYIDISYITLHYAYIYMYIISIYTTSKYILKMRYMYDKKVYHTPFVPNILQEME